MTAWKSVALLSLVPAVALGQGPAGPVDAARRAVAAERQSAEQRQKQADQAAEAEKPGSPPDGSVNLNPAAEKLEGVAPEAEEPPPEGAASALPQRETVPPPDTYTVKSGDTLWDLSGRFLNNPWYWPKVWSYNPEITNPHWIYPGNVLRFYPSSEEAPARVEPVAGAPAEESLEAPRELEDLSKGSIEKPEQLGDEDAVAVVGPYKVGYTAPKAVSVRHDSFVTRRELEESGILMAAFEEKLMLATTDRAYARFRGPAPVKVGETYVIYKTQGPVTHPVTGELFGYKSTIIGAGRVLALDEKAATLVITAAFDPIERGDYLAPWSEKLLKRVPRRPNQRSLDGVIVATQSALVSQIGEHHVVFVDKGHADGVEDGNSFMVLRSGDPYGEPPTTPQNDPALPKEIIGDLLVIDAKEHASAALVSRSLRELFVGDRVEMRAAAGKVSGGR
jgi:hypothetical protein